VVATSSALQELGWKEGDTFFVKRTEMVEREQEQTREQRTGDVESRWASVSEIMGFTSLLCGLLCRQEGCRARDLKRRPPLKSK